MIEAIFSGIGWICLYLWYRDRKKVEKIKNEQYAGEFSAAGKVLLLNLIAGTGAIVMFGIVIFTLVIWIYKTVAS